jgi:hypothetical protein
MITSSVEGAHVPFEIVHRNVFVPGLNPVTPDVGEEGVVTVPVPEIVIQIPVPVTGVFPASVAVVVQTDWSVPAAAVVGKFSRSIIMSSVEGGHVPLEIVHRKVLVPTLKPVTPDVGEAGVVTVPVPEITDHIPVPKTGVFAARVAVEVQSV